MPSRSKDIISFQLSPGRVIGGKYVVEGTLGAGWEGEVYRVIERRTGTTRAAKLFYPRRNVDDRAVKFYVRKLEKLRSCPIVIKYHHSESMRYCGVPVTAPISEYVEGLILQDVITARRGKRLPELEAMQVLYQIAAGLEQIHAKREYHGDLHAGNVLVKRRGVHFDVKLVDLFDLGRPSIAHAQTDVVDLIRLFYDMLGGQHHYRNQRPEIKRIIGGLRRSLILGRYPSARRLREHLDEFEWANE